MLVCFCSLISLVSGNVEINLGTLIAEKNCQSSTVISISHLPVTIQIISFKSILYLINLILFVYLSETYLGFTTPIDDDKLQIPGYTLQIPNSLGDKFSQWDSQNETLITHYEKKKTETTPNVSCFEKIMSHWEYI